MRATARTRPDDLLRGGAGLTPFAEAGFLFLRAPGGRRVLTLPGTEVVLWWSDAPPPDEGGWPPVGLAGTGDVRPVPFRPSGERSLLGDAGEDEGGPRILNAAYVPLVDPGASGFGGGRGTAGRGSPRSRQGRADFVSCLRAWGFPMAPSFVLRRGGGVAGVSVSERVRGVVRPGESGTAKGDQARAPSDLPVLRRIFRLFFVDGALLWREVHDPAGFVETAVAPESAWGAPASWELFLSTRHPLLAPYGRRFYRAAEAALHALYALGLDLGFVDLAETEEGFSLLAVEAPPGLALSQARLLGRFLRRRYPCRRGENPEAPPPTLGADLELLLERSDGRIVPASRWFPEAGEIGCDRVTVRRRDGRERPVLELRPSPKASPEELVGEVRRLLHDVFRRVPTLGVYAGPGRPGLPTGGHVHVSGVPLTFRLLRQFDRYVALPLALLEPVGGARRPRYGFPGDARAKGHGGFEYRTPASFLTSPDTAYAAFILAYAVARCTDRLPALRAKTAWLTCALLPEEEGALAAEVLAAWRELRPLYIRLFAGTPEAVSRIRAADDLYRRAAWSTREARQDLRELWRGGG
ncbi:MAG: hypothetical protein IMX03_08260 [Brockia lithotrophica]|nr:hypothetical protein [Brockia lithotrophica]